MLPSKQEEIFISKQTHLTLPKHIWSFMSKTSLASLKWEELPSVIQNFHLCFTLYPYGTAPDSNLILKSLIVHHVHHKDMELANACQFRQELAS